MGSALVSIIVLARNAQETLTITLDSVLRQSHQHIQLLVCDLASSDQTLPLAKHCADDRVTVLPLATTNELQAITEALLRVRGEFVVVFPAGGIMRPQMIAEQLATFRANPRAAVVVAQHVTVDANGLIAERPVIPTAAQTLVLDAFWRNDIAYAPFMCKKSLTPTRVASLRSFLWDAAFEARLAVTAEPLAGLRRSSSQAATRERPLWNRRYKLLPRLARFSVAQDFLAADSEARDEYIRAVAGLHHSAKQNGKPIFAWLVIAAAFLRRGARRALLQQLKSTEK